MGMPSDRSTVSNTARASGKASARSFPIPGFCDPCPGNSNTTSMLIPKDHRAPREPGAERDEHHCRSFLDATGLDRLVEGDRHRCARRVAVPIDVDEHL